MELEHPPAGFNEPVSGCLSNLLVTHIYNYMQKNTKNYHIITVERLSATNTKGTRVKITSEWFGDTIILPYNYEFDTVKDIAINHVKNTHDIVGSGETRDGYVIISDTFEPLRS